MSVFSVEDLSVTFTHGAQENHAVRGVSFSVDAGQTLAVVGESGSGKSVSLLAATGLLDTRGAVVEGHAFHHSADLLGLDARSVRRMRGKDIGFVFQDPQSNLHPLKTIGDQVAEAITSHERVSRKDVRRRVIDLLDEVGIKEPQRRIDDYPVQFSGGMRQRVMIASAIALQPGVLIADEPTTALDVTVQASILELLRRLQADHGTAIVFVSHDLAVLSDIADHIVVMRRGEVVESADADVLYSAPKHEYTRELLAAAQHEPVVVERPGPAREARELVRIADVHKDYTHSRSKKRTIGAVNGVSFAIGEGEIVGLVGESGSGKSTIGRMVAGLLRPTGGTVALDGADYNTPGARRLVIDPDVRRRIQVVFQDPYSSLNPRRRIRSILAEPFEINTELDDSSIRREVEELVTRVELPLDVLGRYPSQLSGGQRQRIAIARALALKPDLVVADEAVSALDVTTRAHVLKLVRRLRDELGVSFLFISHDLSVVAGLCDRVVVLHDGHIAEHGQTSEVFAHAQSDYTRLLLASIPGRRRPITRDLDGVGARV